jgi:hypothetical protein
MSAKFFAEHSFLAAALVTLLVAAVGYFEHRAVKDPIAAWITWIFGALVSTAAISAIPVSSPWNWVVAATWFVTIVTLLTRYLRRERKRRHLS